LFAAFCADGRLYFASSAQISKYTAEDGWAADGLDLVHIHEDMDAWDHVKTGKEAPEQLVIISLTAMVAGLSRELARGISCVVVMPLAGCLIAVVSTAWLTRIGTAVLVMPVTVDDCFAVVASSTGKAVHLLCWAYPDAVDMILGDKALPKGLRASCNGPAPTAAAASYVYTAG
jgi:hypothetical protein